MYGFEQFVPPQVTQFIPEPVLQFIPEPVLQFVPPSAPADGFFFSVASVAPESSEG